MKEPASHNTGDLTSQVVFTKYQLNTHRQGCLTIYYYILETHISVQLTVLTSTAFASIDLQANMSVVPISN